MLQATLDSIKTGACGANQSASAQVQCFYRQRHRLRPAVGALPFTLNQTHDCTGGASQLLLLLWMENMRERQLSILGKGTCITVKSAGHA